jgi:hypothetical protein
MDFDINTINLILISINLISSFILHLKHSKCCFGMIDIDMKSNTPTLDKKILLN